MLRWKGYEVNGSCKGEQQHQDGDGVQTRERSGCAETTDLATRLAALVPQWTLVDGTLLRSVVFEDFRAAMTFIGRVADEAERLNHHPTWTNTYNRVQITLTTHDAGNQVTELDIELAEQIDRLTSELSAD